MTNDDQLAEKMRLRRNFDFHGPDTVPDIGTNGKMSEPSAATGLTSLGSMASSIDHDRENYRVYREPLSPSPGLRFYPYNEAEQRNFQYVLIELDPALTGIARDDLGSVLHAESVRVRRYSHPACHRIRPYRSYYPGPGLLLPRTGPLHACILVFPTGTVVSSEDAARICDLMGLVPQTGAKVATALSSRSGT